MTSRPLASFSHIVLGVSLAALVGCTAQVRVAAPAAYVPPPPPAAVVVASPEVAVQVRVAPPPLPEYEQPPCPVEGWLWTPGYWAWGAAGYYWVPGTWVAPPRVGVLWTPGYWGFVGGFYLWHAGYWGPHVGFYGGVHYGFGYTGVGYAGGRWAGGAFAYNRNVTNINVTVVHNTYNETVINHVNVTRVSYNGGAGGIAAAPSAEERRASFEEHAQPTAAQREHLQRAQNEPTLRASANGGHPSIAATARPAAFHGPGAVPARSVAAAPREALAGNQARGPQTNFNRNTHRARAQQPHPHAQRKPARRRAQKKEREQDQR